MSTTTVKSQLDGMYKEIYADKESDLIKGTEKLLNAIPFREQQRLGESFNMPAILTDEQGITYAGPDDDGYALNASEAMSSKNASLKGSQIVIRSRIGIKAAAAAVAKGPKAFVNATELLVRRMMRSLSKRIEVAMLYGGSGLASVTTVTPVSATKDTYTISAASFAPGIWIGAKNARLDAYDNGGSKLNTNADLVVDSIDVANRTITVTGDATDLGAIETEVGSNPVDLFYKGAYGKEMLGLDGIITTSGSLFGIDNTVYDLWKGQTFANGSAALTFDKLTQALVRAINFGLEEDVEVLVSPRTWQDLNADEAALRDYDSSYKPGQAEKGVNGIVYNHAGIKVKVVQHRYVKEGEAFVVPMASLKRVGAWPEKLGDPVMKDQGFFEVADTAAYEMRAYTDQALFAEAPCKLVKISGIVNS